MVNFYRVFGAIQFGLREIAGLPSELELDDIESRQFDMILLRMQLACASGEKVTLENNRRRVMDIAAQLEEKTTIPAIREQLEYLAAIQENGFWEGIDLRALEDLRIRLRDLVQFLDKKKRKLVYTNFQDEIVGVRHEESPVYMPKMTGEQYEKKVKDYLSNHLNHIVIHRLRTNQPLTEADLHGLETTLQEIGEDEGETLLTDLLKRSGAPSLAYFIRGMVGMDRGAAKAAFAKFLGDRSLTPPQIRFIEMIIDQLTSRGVMEASALYEPPFVSIHSGGPDELFTGKDEVIDGIFDVLREINRGVEVKAG